MPRTQTRQPRRKPVNSLTALGAVIVLGYIAYVRPRTGLALMGATMLVTATWMLKHHKQIWEDYKKRYHKSSNPIVDAFSRPLPFYYSMNVYVIFPLIILLGLLALYAAWRLV